MKNNKVTENRPSQAGDRVNSNLYREHIEKRRRGPFSAGLLSCSAGQGRKKDRMDHQVRQGRRPFASEVARLILDWWPAFVGPTAVPCSKFKINFNVLSSMN